MRTTQGIPVSPGVAIGTAVVIDDADVPVPRRVVPQDQVQRQHERLDEALRQSGEDIEQLRDQATKLLGPETARIFGFHLGMLQDQQLTDQFHSLIDQDRVTAEYAVYSVMRKLAHNFTQQESRYFRDRVSDIWDLERRVLKHLIGEAREELGQLQQEAILFAHDLTPSQTAGLDTDKIKGIATDAGGRTSHTAILAHALGIPAIVGLEDVTGSVNTGDTVIVDGHSGHVVIDPDAAQLMEYRQQLRQRERFESSLDRLSELPARTRDGTDIQLLANIEFPSEIPAALGKGAAGIGLYRTEFLFLAAESEPTEDEQYEAYREAIRLLEGRPLTIRTVDLGADKLGDADPQLIQERNPFLGCRSIRLCLQNLPMFKTQLKAILRASAEGPARIMFPLISSVMELRQAKMVLEDVIEELEEQGVAYQRDIPVGMMIEVPSAALQARNFTREVDFFSIGTNDLTQYTLAVDRANERVASLYSAAHPAVIQLIKEVVRAAKRRDFDVSICGEMAGQPEFVMLLLGMGLRTLSITPPAIPEVKKVVRSLEIRECQRVARRIASYASDREVTNTLREELEKVLPEVCDGQLVGP